MGSVATFVKSRVAFEYSLRISARLCIRLRFDYRFIRQIKFAYQQMKYFIQVLKQRILTLKSISEDTRAWIILSIRINSNLKKEGCLFPNHTLPIRTLNARWCYYVNTTR